MTGMLDLLNIGQSNLDRLDDPDELKNAAETIFEVAEKFGSTWLIPASDHAQRILGAMLMVHGSEINRAGSAESAVVFDVNLASGTLLARAARAARSDGAERVYAVALHTLVNDFESDDFEDIAIVNRSTLSSGFAESQLDLTSSGLSLEP